MAVIAAGLAAGARADAVVLDALLAVAGDRPITATDARIARDLELVPAMSTDAELLERLVDRVLMLAEVERFQAPDPLATAVESAFTALRTRVGPTRWAEALARSGVTDEHVRAWLRDDLRLGAYLQQRFGTLAGPGPGEEDEPEGDEQRARRLETAVAEWVRDLRSRTAVVVNGIPQDSGR
jgi:hypothetical protein